MFKLLKNDFQMILSEYFRLRDDERLQRTHVSYYVSCISVILINFGVVEVNP